MLILIAPIIAEVIFGAVRCGAAILLAIAGGIRMATLGRKWTTEATYALIAGALPTSWLLGFLIAAVSGGNPVVNVAGHLLRGIVMFVSLRRLHLRMRERESESQHPSKSEVAVGSTLRA